MGKWDELLLPEAFAPAAAALGLGWRVAIPRWEAVAGLREWAWGD